MASSLFSGFAIRVQPRRPIRAAKICALMKIQVVVLLMP
jgi:hypothetical protein